MDVDGCPVAAPGACGYQVGDDLSSSPRRRCARPAFGEVLASSFGRNVELLVEEKEPIDAFVRGLLGVVFKWALARRQRDGKARLGVRGSGRLGAWSVWVARPFGAIAIAGRTWSSCRLSWPRCEGGSTR